jgi:enoyl-CoA hydratase
MAELVTYGRDGQVATITMDDGKVNALSLEMQAELNQALDRAESDRAIVVLTGRTGIFSAGFHLPTLQAGGPDGAKMVIGGFRLSERLLSFPTPVVIACSGHAIAMAAFLLLSADYRVGAAGSFRVTANEVSIGLRVPDSAIEICRQRLSPTALLRAVALSEVFEPEEARQAGFLDAVVEPEALAETARTAAERLAALDLGAHYATKLRVQGEALDRLRATIEADEAQGLSSLVDE